MKAKKRKVKKYRYPKNWVLYNGCFEIYWVRDRAVKIRVIASGIGQTFYAKKP